MEISEIKQIGFGQPSLTSEYFETDRLILVYYPAGAGGKFLINALGLSNQSVLQDIELAKKQHQGRLSSDDKLNLITKRYQKRVYDADLSCAHLFGLVDIQYPTLKEYYPFNNFIKTIIENKYYFFMVTHTATQLKNMLEVWPQARLIYFTNGNNIIEKYRTGRLPQYHRIAELTEWWNLNRQPTWPEMPPAWQESLNAPPFSDISNFDNFEFLKKLLDLLPNKSIFEKVEQTEYQLVEQVAKSIAHSYCWDADWYEDKDMCLKQVELLYQKLELSDYNVDRIDRLYSVWKQQLST